MVEFESCMKCKHDKKTQDEFPCNTCVHGVSTEDFFVPKIQNDRINNMSPEEKAEWLFEHDRITAEKGRLSKEELLQWLKSEVKE